MCYCCGYAMDYYYEMVGNECHFRKGQVVGVDYKPRIDMSLTKLKMLYCDRVDLYSEQFRISESRHIKFDFWFDFGIREFERDIIIFGEFAFLFMKVMVIGAKVVSPSLSYCVADNNLMHDRVEYNYSSADGDYVYIAVPVEMCYTLLNASESRRSEILVEMFDFRIRARQFVSYMHLQEGAR